MTEDLKPSVTDEAVERVARAIWPEIGTDYTYDEAVARANGLPDDDATQAHHQQAIEYANDLARAALQAMPSVTVKKLEWEECNTYTFTAWTEFGNYNIDRDGDGWWCFMHECHGDAFEESLADSFMDDESIVDQLKSEAQADFIRRCLSQITTQPAEAHPDDEAVVRFALAMKAKLKHAREVKGRSGWDTDSCSDDFLAAELVDHLRKGNTGTFEDVANFCMMLHQREASPHELAAAYHRAQAYDPYPTQPVDVAEAAKVLLSDDIAMSRMGKAMHDGPLLADEYEYRADTKAGGWCLDCIRAALRALTQQAGESG